MTTTPVARPGPAADRPTQGFLLLCALAFGLIGANTFHDPLAALAPLGLAVNEVSALNELRANYGGLQIGMGLFLLAGLWRPRLAGPALLAQALLLGGLVVGRLVGLALDGRPNTLVLGLLALESLTTLVSLALLARHRPSL